MTNSKQIRPSLRNEINAQLLAYKINESYTPQDQVYGLTYHDSIAKG